jgi:heme/copper-type cytochrome/quinol oxidase subunit 2
MTDDNEEGNGKMAVVIVIVIVLVVLSIVIYRARKEAAAKLDAGNGPVAPAGEVIE